MARGNIIKGDQDFGTLKSHGFWYCGIAKSPLLPLAIPYRMPFIFSSCQKFEKVSGAYIDKI